LDESCASIGFQGGLWSVGLIWRPWQNSVCLWPSVKLLAGAQNGAEKYFFSVVNLASNQGKTLI
jgi:hypothetical protein